MNDASIARVLCCRAQRALQALYAVCGRIRHPQPLGSSEFLERLVHSLTPRSWFILYVSPCPCRNSIRAHRAQNIHSFRLGCPALRCAGHIYHPLERCCPVYPANYFQEHGPSKNPISENFSCRALFVESVYNTRLSNTSEGSSKAPCFSQTFLAHAFHGRRPVVNPRQPRRPRRWRTELVMKKEASSRSCLKGRSSGKPTTGPKRPSPSMTCERRTQRQVSDYL